MKEAVIVSTARTGIGKAYKGAFNNTNAPTLGGWAIEAAVKKAGINPQFPGLWHTDRNYWG